MTKTGQANGSFCGNLISERLLSNRDHFLKDLAQTVDCRFVREACRDFYGTHLAAEREATRDLPQTAAAYDALAAHAQALPAHACLVRLAWGSGRDATTVAYALQDARSPASRRLADGGFPLGWAELAVLDAEGQPVAAAVTTPTVGARPERKPPKAQPRTLRDLQAGMELEGTVRNLADFGAFVDVGVGRDGLVHTSQLAGRTVKVGDRVRVQVIKVEQERNRFGLRLLEVVR
jgi:hypothetical protein